MNSSDMHDTWQDIEVLGCFPQSRVGGKLSSVEEGTKEK